MVSLLRWWHEQSQGRRTGVRVRPGVEALEERALLSNLIGFRSVGDFPVDQYARPMAVGDFDGNGTQDIAVFDKTNSVSVLLSNVDGTLQPPLTSSSVSGTPQGVVVADFDGDGALDLAVATNAGGTYVSLLRGRGN